ncbi:hypothetical protein RvY_17922-1 [Ramazzottius varieornatus]|uniref:Uncharacterized protein n=1 Tax=Ramazzottius varieornatus TaxID=947166 RepID=A0A1D1W3Y0_RAMVA|nr:hypothetical protein RvY_17922-1 [Ramazzottius varieornatus]
MEFLLSLHHPACTGYLTLLGTAFTGIAGNPVSTYETNKTVANVVRTEPKFFDGEYYPSSILQLAYSPLGSTRPGKPIVSSTSIPLPQDNGHPALIAALVFVIIFIVAMSIVYHRHKAKKCYLQGRADAVAELPPPLPRRPNAWALNPAPGEYVESNEAQTPKEISKLSRLARQRVNNVYSQPTLVPDSKPRLSFHEYDEMATAGNYTAASQKEAAPPIPASPQTAHGDTTEERPGTETRPTPIYEEIGPRGLKHN